MIKLSVKVPITKPDVVGQKSARARKDQRLREEFKKQQLTIPPPNSNLQYLKNVHDEGRFQIDQSARSTTGTLASIVAPAGMTFYYLGGVWDAKTTNANVTIFLRNDGVTVESHSNQIVPSQIFGTLGLQFDSMIGDGTRAYTLEVTFTGTGSARGTIFGYFASTPTVV